MTILEILLSVILLTLTILLTFLAVSALQLIKELKNSLSHLNKLLEKPDSLHPAPLKKFEDLLTFPYSVSKPSTPHLFRRKT